MCMFQTFFRSSAYFPNYRFRFESSPLILTVKSAEISETWLESLTVYWPQSIVSACLMVMVACVRVVVTTNWIRVQRDF